MPSKKSRNRSKRYSHNQYKRRSKRRSLKKSNLKKRKITRKRIQKNKVGGAEGDSQTTIPTQTTTPTLMEHWKRSPPATPIKDPTEGRKAISSSSESSESESDQESGLYDKLSSGTVVIVNQNQDEVNKNKYSAEIIKISSIFDVVRRHEPPEHEPPDDDREFLYSV